MIPVKRERKGQILSKKTALFFFFQNLIKSTLFWTGRKTRQRSSPQGGREASVVALVARVVYDGARHSCCRDPHPETKRAAPRGTRTGPGLGPGHECGALVEAEAAIGPTNPSPHWEQDWQRQCS